MDNALQIAEALSKVFTVLIEEPDHHASKSKGLLASALQNNHFYIKGDVNSVWTTAIDKDFAKRIPAMLKEAGIKEIEVVEDNNVVALKFDHEKSAEVLAILEGKSVDLSPVKKWKRTEFNTPRVDFVPGF